ncbi:hypothetical protein IWW50_004382 [Coemansia erecta]|nr:hypothetical protein IWW50_004382 [Coemansia erecta]
MPVNNNTDMQFYQNTWVANHLFAVCDFGGPGCAMSCNEKSTWLALDRKTKCFTRAIKHVLPSTEFFLKQDDDVLADRDYVQGLMEKYRGHPNPLFISDLLHHDDHINIFSLNDITHGNGKFYMFNRRLLDCLNVDVKYIGQRYEDTVFGGMIHTGCKGLNVTFVQERNSKIWHRTYRHKNKAIDLSALRNH